ncbi:serine-threonine/tyrosine-protein kinase catalytic domain-containing protein, partial [Tanacetum coccineum]
MSIMKHWEHLKIPFEKIDVATEKFKTCIGRGGYGWVYKGVLSIDGKDTTVDVKRLNEQFGQGLKEFLTEIQLLSGQEHPNLISLLGYCDEGKEKIIVYQYAARGSLDTYIRRNRDKNSTTLTWLKRLKICANAARGLDHLHNHIGGHRTIIHRDIKSSNILLDENWVAKISDLGLSKLSVTGFGMSLIVSNGCGTHGYCEPEYYTSGVVTKKSDVYSFGIVLFEVLCGRLCIIEPENGFILHGKSVKEYYNKGHLVQIIDPSLREHMGSYSMTKFLEIAYRCLHDDREQRPAMDIVAKELEDTLNVQVAHELEEKRKHQVVKDSDSDEYWEAKLPTDWEVLINMFNIPSDISSSKKKLVSHLREGLLFDQDNQIEVATKCFRTCIGVGGYGVVYKGVLSINGKDTTVAVKRLDMQFGQGLKEFLTEIQLLSGQEHPNLISLLGYCNHGKEKILVYEYAARGSLDSYIRRNSSTNLTWLGRLKICADAARGLDHLHNHLGRHRMIIHRDIKSSNILIDENWVAKISDLGLSKLGVTGFGMSDIVTNGCGTHGYCEPEYFNTAVVTKKSDVYSFGIVLFEVLCGRLCLTGSDGFILSEKSVKDYYNRGNLVKIIDPNLREHMGSYSITKFSEIAYRCLHEDRQRRPAMDIVVKELEEVLVAHGLEEKRKYHVVDDSDSDEYWETKLPRDWEALINMFNIPSDTCSSKKKLVSHLREGLHFDKDKQFFFINDDGKKCVTISARKFLACKESLFQRSLRFLKLAGYPNCRYLQGTKCRIEVSMLSVGTMYAASLMFKYRWKRDENLIPKKLITIKWTMEELSVYSIHYAELISENWYKIRMWHFMNHGLIANFDIVLEELSYFRKTDKSDLLIKGIEFEPHEKNEEDIDDVDDDDDDDEYWEKRLPDEYQRYIEMSDKPFDYTTKKELYLSLCQGFLGCNGQMWFSLCKSTSGICSILPATHISSQYHLKTLSLSESRFKEVVRLETHKNYSFSCRLGSFMFSPHYTYACYLVFKYEENQVVSHDACFYTAKCNLGDNNMTQGTVSTSVSNIPTLAQKKDSGSPDSSKSIQMPNKDMDLEHSFVDKRNDGWMEVRLTKPLHQLESYESLEVELEEPNSSIRIIVEGMEFRPVVHDGSNLMAERSANRNIIGKTNLHGTSDLDDKTKEDIDEYWEKKLPHNYPHLIELSDIPLNYTTKKELYLLFCRGFLANNGQLWFSTCNSTSGICSIQPAKRVLYETHSYNELETLSLPESRFKEVKKLGKHYLYEYNVQRGELEVRLCGFKELNISLKGIIVEGIEFRR